MTTRRMVIGACKAAGLMLVLAALANSAHAGAGPPTPIGRRPSDCCLPQVPEIDPGSALGAFALLSRRPDGRGRPTPREMTEEPPCPSPFGVFEGGSDFRLAVNDDPRPGTSRPV